MPRIERSCKPEQIARNSKFNRDKRAAREREIAENIANAPEGSAAAEWGPKPDIGYGSKKPKNPGEVTPG